MIIRNRLSWLRMLVTFRGSSLEETWPRIAAATLFAVAVTYVSLHYEIERYTFTVAPFTMIGIALSIFLGFRNNASYDRFWEARIVWGALVNTCRTLARQAESLVDVAPDVQNQTSSFRDCFTRRVIAFAHALRLHLRDQDAPEQLQAFLSSDEYREVVDSKHRPLTILAALGRHVQQAKHDGLLDSMAVLAIDRQLMELSNVMGACERIKKTPIPFPYRVLIHRIVVFFCFFLPFGLVDTVRWLTPVVIFFVAHAFFGLDVIGEQIEDPFDGDPNRLPLTAISRTIEINLLERLGDEHPPQAIQPVDFVLD